MKRTPFHSGSHFPKKTPPLILQHVKKLNFNLKLSEKTIGISTCGFSNLTIIGGSVEGGGGGK